MAKPARTRWNGAGLDVVLLGLGALAIRLPAYVSSRELVVDEGVYSSAALAMRDGARPFRQVFSAQGPLHLPLVYAFDLLGGRTLDSPRLLAVVSGIVVTLAIYATARLIGTRASALLAAALVATTGSILWTTAPLTGDGPAAAFTALAVLGAFAWRARPTTLRALLAGLAFGAALAVKVLVATAAIPIFLLFVLAAEPARRRIGDLAVATGGAVAVIVVSTVPWGVRRVVDQSVTYHTKAPRIESIGSQLDKLLSTVPTRDLPLLAAAVIGLVATALAARRHGATDTRGRDVVVVLAWLVPLVVLLVVEKNMWRPHLAALMLPLALLVALRPPPARVFALALVFLVPWWAVHLHDILWPAPYHGDTAAVIAELRALPEGAWVMSDDPGLAWRAGRRVPANLVDGSVLRIDEHLVTTETVRKAGADDRVCAAVVWSTRWGRDLPGLPAALRATGFTLEQHYGPHHDFWRKQSSRCSTTSR
jgi:4-amino-4-deoxy-L-arabinose transferase-like glycosyltransferase